MVTLLHTGSLPTHLLECNKTIKFMNGSELTCDSAQTGDTDTTSHLKKKHSLEDSRCAVPGVWNIISRFYNVLLLTANPTEGTTPEVSTNNKKEKEYCQLFVQ